MTRVCTRVSEVDRRVPEGPKWLIWTVYSYTIIVECTHHDSERVGAKYFG